MTGGAPQRLVPAGEAIGAAGVPLAFALQSMQARGFGVFASIPTIATGVSCATVAVVLRLMAEHRGDG